MKKKAIKIIGWEGYLSGILLCTSNPTTNEPVLKQIIGLVLVIISLPILLGSLGGLND
mgnify:CR=1 FL=1